MVGDRASISVDYEHRFRQGGTPFDKEIDSDKLNKLILSERDRKEKKHAIFRAVMDGIGYTDDNAEERKNDIENINLLFGRWPNQDKSGLSVSVHLDDDKEGSKSVSFGRDSLNHTPMMDKVGQQAVSSMMGQNTKFIAKDDCKHSVIYKRDLKKKLIKEKFIDLYVKPITTQAESMLDAKYGPDLTPEMQAQRQQEFDSIVGQLMSDEIKNIMENIKVPGEKLYQKLFNIARSKSDFDYQLYKGANYAVATGKEFYRRRFGHNSVYIETIKTYNARWCLSENSEFIQDGIWFSYDRWLTPVEIVSEYFHVFKNKDFKQIEAMMTDIPVAYGDADERIHYDQQMPDDLPEYLELETYPATVNKGTGEVTYGDPVQENGEVFFKEETFNSLCKSYRKNRGLKVTYYTWRWLAKAKRVRRKVRLGNNRFSIKTIIRGESYVLDKERGDLDFEWTAIPRTAEGERCGNFYFNLGDVPYQNMTAEDYDKPHLGCYGAVYNTLDGAIKNMSFMDPMKPTQHRINVLEDVLSEKVANDLGDVLVVDKETANKGKGGLDAFFNLLYKFKIIMSSSKTNQSVYSVNLGSNSRISSLVQLLSYYKAQLMELGSTNEVELGGQGQYATRANISSSLESARRTKFRLFYMNRQVRLAVANALAQGAFYAYKDSDHIKECYLTDEEKIHYEENFYEMAGSSMYMELDENPDGPQNLATYKQYLANYLGHGGDMEALGNVLDSVSMSEAKEIAARATQEKMRRDKEAQKIQNEANMAVEQQRTQTQQAADDRADKRAIINKEARVESAYLNSLGLAHANDINENGRADFVESKDKDRILKNKEIMLNYEIQKAKIEAGKKN